jgi:hypothetical protein
MKAYGGVDVQINLFLTSALAGGEWSASRSGRFTPGERASGTHWIGGWVDPGAGLDDVEKRKFLTLPGLELRPFGRYTGVEDSKFDFKNCRGKGLDNGSNMRGIKRVFKRVYVRKNNEHILCLVAAILVISGDAAISCTEAGPCFRIIHCVYILLPATVEIWKILKDNVPYLLSIYSATHWEFRIVQSH